MGLNGDGRGRTGLHLAEGTVKGNLPVPGGHGTKETEF